MGRRWGAAGGRGEGGDGRAGRSRKRAEDRRNCEPCLTVALLAREDH